MTKQDEYRALIGQTKTSMRQRSGESDGDFHKRAAVETARKFPAARQAMLEEANSNRPAAMRDIGNMLG